jgi:hypothetical protein
MEEIAKLVTAGGTAIIALGIFFVVLMLGILLIRFWRLIDTSVDVLRKSEGLEVPKDTKSEILSKLQELETAVNELKKQCEAPGQGGPTTTT